MQHRSAFGMLTSLLFLVYVGWMFIAPDPMVRIERACKPVEWTGNLAVSITALTIDSATTGTRQAFENLTYGCEYSIWRLFYEEEYAKAAPETWEGGAQ